MTIREYITQKYASFGVANASAEVEAVLSSIDQGADEALNSSTIRDVEVAFVRRVPDLLLYPTSVSELGVSISRAGVDALRAYYKAKCAELGIEDLLDKPARPRVSIY